MSTRTKRASTRRVAGFVAAIGALVMSSGVAMLITAPSANAAADKYFVCKYVHTPGNTEVLQTGQNPISVSVNAIPEDPVVVGSSFSDQQGRSYVLSEDNTPPGPEGDPSASDCPIGDQNVLIAVDVVFVDPTCDNDNTASYSLTGDTDDVTVEQSADPAAGVEETVTATAKDGFEFAGGETTYSETHTFGDAADCTVTPPVEPPVVTPPVVEPPVATPTIVHAGLIGNASDNSRNQQGLALLASGLLLLMAAGGVVLRGARR
jgi:hypothetical protein